MSLPGLYRIKGRTLDGWNLVYVIPGYGYGMLTTDPSSMLRALHPLATAVILVATATVITISLFCSLVLTHLVV